MSHPELDELLDLVRGDAASDEVLRHVDGCARCTDQLTAARRLDAASQVVVDERRHDTPPRGIVPPPGSVWDAVQAELAPVAPVVLAPRRPTGRRPRRPVAAAVVAAAAVVGAVLGGVGGYVLGGRSASDGPAVVSADPVAVGTLGPASPAAVSAEVAMNRLDGRQSMTITFSEAVRGPGYVEAWLLDPATNEMLGLGVLDAEGGTVTVPDGVDLTRFTTVDISREPFDGDPAHSDESLARGLLRTV